MLWIDKNAIVPHREMVIILIGPCMTRSRRALRLFGTSATRTRTSQRSPEDHATAVPQRQEAQMHQQQDHELKQMEMATKIIKKKFREDWDKRLSGVEMECEMADQLLSQKQLKGRRMLKRRIHNLPKPKNRMSKQMVALIQAEKHMAKNHQYRDAAELNRRIQKQMPVEKARFRRVYEKRIENMRVNHAKRSSSSTLTCNLRRTKSKLSVRDEKALEERAAPEAGNHQLALRHALKNEAK